MGHRPFRPMEPKQPEPPSRSEQRSAVGLQARPPQAERTRSPATGRGAARANIGKP